MAGLYRITPAIGSDGTQDGSRIPYILLPHEWGRTPGGPNSADRLADPLDRGGNGVRSGRHGVARAVAKLVKIGTLNVEPLAAAGSSVNLKLELIAGLPGPVRRPPCSRQLPGNRCARSPRQG